MQEISKMKTVDNFRNKVKSETDKIENLVQKWTSLNELDSIPEEARGHINSTKGLALLLINERFKQFNKLINDCEHNTGFKEITCKDLLGFWEMIYFQVEDVFKRFDKLDELKENNWQEKMNDVIDCPTKDKENNNNNNGSNKKVFKSSNISKVNQNKKSDNSNGQIKSQVVKSVRSTSALRSHIMKARAQVARSNSAGELLIISESMKENKSSTAINSPNKVNIVTTKTNGTIVTSPPPLSPVVTVSENSIPVVEKENKVTITVTKTADALVKEMNGNHAEKDLLQDSLKSKPV